MPEIIECEQRSEEWFRAHIGIPTASMFAEVMMQGRKKGEPSATRAQFVRRKAGELITGQPDPRNYTNANMQRGIEMEDEARTKYQFLNPGLEVQRVGFIHNLKAGCSPDALLGGKGMLEIKTTFPDLLLDHHNRQEFPPEHRPQCQGQLWVAERDWVDLIIYWPGVMPFIIRAERDEPYIKEIETAVNQFNFDVAEQVERYRKMGGSPWTGF
jgi:hypothetical protein